jgi:hypothetical protein
MQMRTERTKLKALLVMGMTGVAIFPTLMTLLERSGHTSDLTDFALGGLIGASAGLLMVAIWYGRRTGSECG